MRKLTLILVLQVLSASIVMGQSGWILDFDILYSLYYSDKVQIDTITDTNNIWKIGGPHKQEFLSAYSMHNAIVTDTLNPYPVNDTSSFTVIHIASWGWGGGVVNLGGWYFVDSDTLTDFGYIEFSADKGASWFSVDSSQYNGCCFTMGQQVLPVLSGNSHGWTYFFYCLCTSSLAVNIGDTILYRFTFISDSIQTNKDGLMFDDLQFEDWTEGMDEINSGESIHIFPNPTSTTFSIRLPETFGNPEKLEIFNNIGQMVGRFESVDNVDISEYSPGLYYIAVWNQEGERLTGRVVKE